MPVLDHAGHVVWRVKVAPAERTCLACGDTFPGDYWCVRCGLNEDGTRRDPPPQSVPTTDYLQDNEYEIVR